MNIEKADAVATLDNRASTGYNIDLRDPFIPKCTAIKALSVTALKGHRHGHFFVRFYSEFRKSMQNNIE